MEACNTRTGIVKMQVRFKWTFSDEQPGKAQQASIMVITLALGEAIHRAIDS